VSAGAIEDDGRVKAIRATKVFPNESPEPLVEGIHMMAVFFSHACGGTLLYMQPDGSVSDAVPFMSSADLYDFAG
jgi:hypothetical protein